MPILICYMLMMCFFFCKAMISNLKHLFKAFSLYGGVSRQHVNSKSLFSILVMLFLVLIVSFFLFCLI